MGQVVTETPLLVQERAANNLIATLARVLAGVKVRSVEHDKAIISYYVM